MAEADLVTPVMPLNKTVLNKPIKRWIFSIRMDKADDPAPLVCLVYCKKISEAGSL